MRVFKDRIVNKVKELLRARENYFLELQQEAVLEKRSENISIKLDRTLYLQD